MELSLMLARKEKTRFRTGSLLVTWEFTDIDMSN